MTKKKKNKKNFNKNKKANLILLLMMMKNLKKIEILGKIKESNLVEKYELLINILKNDVKEDLQLDSSKNINKIIKIDFDDIESCEIKYYKLELDCTGIIQEQLNLQKGKIIFKNCIKDLLTFIKRDKNVINIPKIDNKFKSPIIFKNFEEESILPNEAFICEIKSGFVIHHSKLNKRKN